MNDTQIYDITENRMVPLPQVFSKPLDYQAKCLVRHIELTMSSNPTDDDIRGYEALAEQLLENQWRVGSCLN